MSLTLPELEPLSNSSSMTHSPCLGDRPEETNLAPSPVGDLPPRTRKVVLKFRQVDVETRRVEREANEVREKADVTGNAVKKRRSKKFEKEKTDCSPSTATPTRIYAVPSRAVTPTASEAATPILSLLRSTRASPNKPPPPLSMPLRAPERRTRVTVTLAAPPPSIAPRRSNRKGAAAAARKAMERASETAWLKDATIQPRVMGAACDRAASARGALERLRFDAAFPDREAVDSDEEEWLSEEVGKYFRTVTPEVEARRAVAVAGLNVVGKPLSLSGKVGGKPSSIDDAGIKKLIGKGKNVPANVRLNVARRPTVPFHDTPTKLVVLRLENADVEQDLMAMTGRDLKQERLTLSPRSCKGKKGEAARADSTRAASEEARISRVTKRAPTGSRKAAKGPNWKAAAKVAAGKAGAARAAASKSARAVTSAIPAAAAAKDVSCRATVTRGGSSRKRRVSEVEGEMEEMEDAARRRPKRRALPSKVSKSSSSFGGDTKLFVKHKGKKGWVLCRKCGCEVWPPNCGKHTSACGA